MGFFDKLKNITGGMFGGVTEVDDDFFDELEERLILADMGVEVASDAVRKLRDRVYAYRLRGEEQLKEALRDILALQMREDETAMDLSTQPSVILVVGVNGVGKTTSIGKIAHLLRREGKSVLLCAAEKCGVPLFEYTPGQVKLAVTGYGKAEKRQVMDMTKRLLHLAALPRPDDAADALALALCHARSSTSQLPQTKPERETI